MKTRVIQTRFWEDNFVTGLDVDSKLVFLYLLTNDSVGMTGVYEKPLKFIAFSCGMTEQRIMKALEALEGKVLYREGWVVLLNAHKYNNYAANAKQRVAYVREWNALPDELKKYAPFFDQKRGVMIYPNTELKDTSMIGVSYPYHTTPNTETRNKKPEIRNQKPERGDRKKTQSNTTTPSKVDLGKTARSILDEYNRIFNRSLKSVKGFEGNLAFWLEDYTLDDIVAALRAASMDVFWKDKMTPEILLRRKAPNGEPVNRIQFLLNKRAAVESEFDKFDFSSDK